MVTNVKLGPEGGPFVELDEDTGDFIIRVPNDSVDFDLNELSNISNLIANSAEIDGNTSPYAQDPHDVGGAQHAADTLANLNSKISDATLDDTTDTRDPTAHGTEHEATGVDEINVAGLSGQLANIQLSQIEEGGSVIGDFDTLNFGGDISVIDDTSKATITAQAGDNVPDWVEDGNSPQTVTNQTALSYTLAGTYDIVKVFVKSVITGDFTEMYVTANGDTGANYVQQKEDGSSVTGANNTGEILGSGDAGGRVNLFHMAGRWDGAWSLSVAEPGDSALAVDAARNDSVVSPLDSFAISDRLGKTLDEITVEVFGRDVA